LDYLATTGWVQAAFTRRGESAGRKGQTYAVNLASLTQRAE